MNPGTSGIWTEIVPAGRDRSTFAATVQQRLIASAEWSCRSAASRVTRTAGLSASRVGSGNGLAKRGYSFWPSPSAPARNDVDQRKNGHDDHCCDGDYGDRGRGDDHTRVFSSSSFAKTLGGERTRFSVELRRHTKAGAGVERGEGWKAETPPPGLFSQNCPGTDL